MDHPPRVTVDGVAYVPEEVDQPQPSSADLMGNALRDCPTGPYVAAVPLVFRSVQITRRTEVVECVECLALVVNVLGHVKAAHPEALTGAGVLIDGVLITPPGITVQG